MPRAVRVRCPAKVNLFLEVLGRRPDGYHELATVMCAVSLWDDLEVRAARRDSLDVRPVGAAPAGADNTAARALAELRLRVKIPPVRVRLRKRIPAGSGLGGGSSDAAGLVRAVDRLFGLELSDDVRREALAAVGSDTVFFDRGGCALCTGRGEIVSPLPAPRLHLVVAAPPFDCPTREVYTRLKSSLTSAPQDVTEFLNTLRSGDVERIGRALFNRMERPAFDHRPQLRGVRDGLAALPFAGVLMSGSGSAVFGLCRSAAERVRRHREARELGVGRVYGVRTLGPDR